MEFQLTKEEGLSPQPTISRDRLTRMWKQRLVWLVARAFQNGNHMAEIECGALIDLVLRKYPRWFKNGQDVGNTIDELVPLYLKNPYGSALRASNIGADYFALIPTLWRFLGDWGLASILAIITVLPNGVAWELLDVIKAIAQRH